MVPETIADKVSDQDISLNCRGTSHSHHSPTPEGSKAYSAADFTQ